MAKRFTDTDMWDKEWFMTLSCKHKCLVKFVRDKCDLSGVWSPNFVIASAYIGEPVTEAELLKIDGGNQFVKTAAGKIFCIGFINFQYGTLSEKSPVHRKILNLLSTHKIDYKYPINRVQEEEEDKEEEKEKEKEKEKSRELEILISPVDTEKKEITLKILRDFGFNEINNPDKMRIISGFVYRITDVGRLQYFSDQYRAYMEYKKLSGEAKHNLITFLGHPQDDYKGGGAGWDSANWTEKLKNYHDGKSKSTIAADRINSVANLGAQADRILAGC